MANTQEGTDYWKAEALRVQSLYHKLAEENQEMETCNKEIEQELEAQVEETDRENKKLKQQNTSLTFEFESLKEKYEKAQKSHYSQVNDLQDQLTKLQVTNSDLIRDKRELEQKNDDLERSNRMIMASLGELERRLGQESEKNALLESEIVEKNKMAITVQRLKDEKRDLNEELNVRNMKLDDMAQKDHEQLDNKENNEKAQEMNSSTPESPVTKRFSPMSNGISTNNNISPTTPLTPDNRRVLLNGNNNDMLAASPRIYALSIVGDLLRKVGALESKLASCRNIVADQSTRSGRTLSTSSSTPKSLHESIGENNNNNNNPCKSSNV